MNKTSELGYLVNLQDNGLWMGGVWADYSGPTLTARLAKQMLLEPLSGGVLTCPTTITQDFEQGCRNLGFIAAALSELGMHGRWQHAEWPFFRVTKALGAHPKQHVKPADIALLDRMVEASRNTIAIITVGPDVKGILPLIEKAVEYGIVVSLGHHLATPTQVAEAISAGATWLTHLYNGIPRQIERQGILDYQLDCSLGAMFIPDGTHVEDYVIHLMLQVKGIDRVIAVSDRSCLGGAPVTPEGTWHEIWDGEVRVEKHPTLETCRIVGKNGMFAGSWANFHWCMDYMASLFAKWNAAGEEWSDADLWKIGCTNPMRLLGKQVDEWAGIPRAKLRLEDGRFRRYGADS